MISKSDSLSPLKNSRFPSETKGLLVVKNSLKLLGSCGDCGFCVGEFKESSILLLLLDVVLLTMLLLMLLLGL